MQYASSVGELLAKVTSTYGELYARQKPSKYQSDACEPRDRKDYSHSR